MKKEIWLPVVGYEGLYSVSNFGNVMSMNYSNTGLLKMLSPSTPRNNRSYPKVSLYKYKKARYFTVHSLVARAFLGEPNGREINHINGVKTDNNISNLEYCTASENRAHAFRIGLQSSRGENHSRAKLTDEKVIDIKSRLRNGEKQVSIAKSYNVNASVISEISSGRAWSHVNDDRKVG